MSAPDHHTAVNGKQPAASGSTDQPRPQPAMIVVPPRQEDLQKSYATVVDPDANPKGWYGSMSTRFPPLRLPLPDLGDGDAMSP